MGFSNLCHKRLPTVPEEAAEPGKGGVERNSNTRAVRGLIKAAVGRGQPAFIENPAFTFYLLCNCLSVCLNGRLLSSLSD